MEVRAADAAGGNPHEHLIALDHWIRQRSEFERIGFNTRGGMEQTSLHANPPSNIADFRLAIVD
jgi:hypothetical protein